MDVQLKILNREFYATDSSLLNLAIYPMYFQTSIPAYATKYSAAIDLRCTHDIELNPQQKLDVKTGIAIWLGGHRSSKLGDVDNDIGVAALILPRSSLGSQGLTLSNTIGLIDEDYQGELILKVQNTSLQPLRFLAGCRIAQAVIIPIIRAEFKLVSDFSSVSERGVGGCGSTGTQ